MPDKFTPQQRHNCMSHIRSKNTKPEVKLRKKLFGMGYRYRINAKRLHGSPDIVLAKYHTVIFVNGCFWHGHQGCRYYTRPKTNAEFWAAKVERNQQRDAIDTAKLESLGWNVITVWECELKPEKFDATVEHVNAELQHNLLLLPEEKSRRKSEKVISRLNEMVSESRESVILADYSIPGSIAKLAKDTDNMD